DDGAGPAQLDRLFGIAAERGAVGLEAAEVAEPALVRAEVVAAARGLDGRPQRVGLALEAGDRLVGRAGDDRLWLRQVIELHAGRPPPEHPLAQQRVHVDAAEALGLEELRRHRAR